MSTQEKQSTLIRGIQILEHIVAKEQPVSSVYIANELGLPKPTVHRIAQQLEQHGLIKRELGGRSFVGGKRLQNLATATMRNSTYGAHRKVVMRELSEEVDETCNLTMLAGNEIVYLDRVESNWPFRIHLPVGSHLPLHCTATGKLFLANMQKSNRSGLIHGAPLARYTDLTISDPEVLEQQLQQIKQDGVGCDTGEYLDGMVAIAVPVINGNGKMDLALAIHSPSARKSLDELRQYLPLLRAAAGRLAALESDSKE